ncbi:sensor histidine kinase [Brumimicrobium oceani]|uniref:histidine kinase n=1 Tax=Brumimicrobium oceani TaxID=2100725 RepID=A0A2U2XGP2_9FLAO|nr:ATP-binding protein [Brumimicrobium oceani]PWH86910.1 hypothetical protein DIT68_01225 [Brumimicrobium oceani]
MIKNKKYSYYNYFLMLSLALIAGYFITSLLFLNRTFKSGEEAKQFGMTVEKTNSVIQQITQLETSSYSYVITKTKESEAIYTHKKIRLIEYAKSLGAHCTAHHFANHETEKLNRLISQRIEALDLLMMKDSMSTEALMQQLSFGNETTMEILKTLKKIRAMNNEMQEKSQQEAKTANRNAMVLMTLFGGIMLLIVFISFFKMRKEILRSERYLKEINQINLELSSVNENLENFAFIASHDLNEPLRKIKTFGDLIEIELSNEHFDQKTVTSHVSRMQAAASRMQELIEDLLSYSRIARQFDVRQEINLRNVVDTVISDLEVSIRENNAVIHTHDLPTEIHADEIQMRQIFQNIISNAIKFRKLDIDPIIDINSEIVKMNEVPIKDGGLGDFEEYWKISITDNGIGFDEKYLDKIFAVFQRLHGRSAYEGTGIGLSICKKIAENHKGHLTAYSTEGEGSTFIIYLPVN